MQEEFRMTTPNPTQMDVPVIQSDREKAADMISSFYGRSESYWAEQIRSGQRDNGA